MDPFRAIVALLLILALGQVTKWRLLPPKERGMSLLASIALWVYVSWR